jgi:hypothetical protein
MLMIFMMAMTAFAVDLGYLCVARSELQRSADATAAAACYELMNEDGPQGYNDFTSMAADARAAAVQYASLNPVMKQSLALGTNDVEVGYMANPSNPSCPFVTDSTSPPNAVRIHLLKTSAQNGQLPLFFGKVMGMANVNAQADATAALLYSFSGFEAPSDGSNLELLPFALDEDTWNDLMAGNASDNYSFDPATGVTSVGNDGIKEVNLYPQGTGCPGNRGTVDFGSSNNSTADIARQILHGVNANDLSYLPGGKIQFNSEGKLYLNGDTGISAGVKDELASIVGKPRIIPIFSSVVGPGNNATYTIVKLVGIRITFVKLTGSMSSKAVMIQPCNVLVKGGIPATSGANSTFLYSPVWLVR